MTNTNDDAEYVIVVRSAGYAVCINGQHVRFTHDNICTWGLHAYQDNYTDARPRTIVYASPSATIDEPAKDWYIRPGFRVLMTLDNYDIEYDESMLPQDNQFVDDILELKGRAGGGWKFLTEHRSVSPGMTLRRAGNVDNY